MRLFLIILISYITIEVFSQEYEIVDPIEILARFPSGNDSMFCFIETNLRYDILNLSGKKGKIITSFVIDTTGRVTKIVTNPEYVLKYPWIVQDHKIEEEIKRVLGLMPSWDPARYRNYKVPEHYILAFRIPYTVFNCPRFDHDTSICLNVDTLPDFKFGNGLTLKDRINEFLYSQLKWPSEADCNGTSYIQVIIECDGSLSNFRLIRGFCEEFDAEAMRVVKLMPKWSPAIRSGKSVRSYFFIPVRFVLN